MTLLFHVCVWLSMMTFCLSRDVTEYKKAQVTERNTDEQNNNVELKIQLLSPDQFNKEIKDEFRSIIAEKVNEICEEEPEDCYLREFDDAKSFTKDNIHILSGYPKEDNVGMVLRYTVQYPDSNLLTEDAPSQIYLQREKLHEWTVSAASKFYADTGYHILKVDEEMVKLPPKMTLNIALIAVGFLLLIIVIATYFILRKIYGDRNDQDRLVERKEDGDTEEKEALNHGANSAV